MKSLVKIFPFLVLIFFLKVGTISAYAKRDHIETYESKEYFAAESKIDKIVKKDLDSKGLKATYLCSDFVFLRRLYLDLLGRIPSARELYAFEEMPAKNRRSQLIDKLLASDEFALFMTFRWSDIFKIKAEFPINLWPNAAQAYNKFILDSLRANKPYDQFTREMLTSSGSNFRVGSVNFYRALQGRGTNITADAVCSAFLGIDFTKLEEEKAKNIEKFFTKIAYKATKEWKEEIVYNNFADSSEISTTFLDGKKIQINGDEDPRLALAEAVIDSKYFAQSFVNRAFGRLMGNYLVNPDDILNDKIVNNNLLEHLAKFFVDNNYDIKKLYSEILNSNTYQQSSIPLEDKELCFENFAAYTPRQIEAEVLIDIICEITGSAEVYSSMIPEPFTAMPMYIKSISIPDGSISTGFLDLFGKSQRDTGKELERKSKPSASQRMHLLNSSHIRNKIDYFSKNFANVKDDTFNQSLSFIYATILSRKETSAEKKRIIDYRNASKESKSILFTDLIWALMNSEEFINKH